MTNLLDLSLVELAALYRKKEASPVEAVKGTFERLHKLEPDLNAFITLAEKEAMVQAEAVEKQFLAGSALPLLAGVLYSAKDLFYKKGMPMTCGSNVFRDYQPDYTATVLEKLDAAGAILIGKNNMLEFAYGIVHPDFGQTNNPWDVTKTSGGSSSGSAAAVAGGIGYFSLGTDTGGSIRIPASYCGVVGLKPTRGLVSTYGVFPLSWTLDHAGPIARSAKDAAAVLAEIAGHDVKDPHSLNGKIGAFDLARFKEGESAKKVGVLPSRKLKGLHPEVDGAYQGILKQIHSLGWEVVEIDIELWERTEEIILNILWPQAAQIHQPWMDRKEEYAEMTYRQLQMGIDHKTLAYLEGLKALELYTAQVSGLFGQVDIILTPTVAFPAPAEDPVIGSEELDEMMFTGPFNISGHPAVTLNAGFTADGLPVGIQLVAPHFQDMELLQAAAQLEEAANKRVPPLINRD